RLGGDRRGGGVHHHGGHLGLGGDRAHGVGVGAEVQAGQEVDLVAHDQLLGVAARLVGRGPARVALDDLHVPPGDLAAVFLQIELDAAVELATVVGVRARVGRDHADANGVGGL